MWRRGELLLGFLLLFGVFLPSVAFAHKVSIFAYSEGGIIYTESYFSDGRPVGDGKVLVFDSAERLLLEGYCDKQGLYQFPLPKQDDLTLVIEAGLGHKNRYLLKKSASKE